MAGDDDVGRHLERRDVLKGLGAEATGLAGLLGGCVNNRTSTNTGTPTGTPTATATETDKPDNQTETGTEEGTETPEDEETPEENSIGELLENNIETSNQLWDIMPQGSTEDAGIQDFATQRAVAEKAGFKHKFGQSAFPYADEVKDEDMLGMIDCHPHDTVEMVGFKYNNDTDMEAISDSISEETEGSLDYRGHTLHKANSKIYWAVNAEDNAVYMGIEKDVKLVVDMVEDEEPSMAEKVPWTGSEPFNNNIVLASKSKWSLDNSNFGITAIKKKMGGEVKDVMDTVIYDPEEEQAYEVVWTYDGDEWQEDERISVVLPVALEYVHAE